MSVSKLDLLQSFLKKLRNFNDISGLRREEDPPYERFSSFSFSGKGHNSQLRR